MLVDPNYVGRNGLYYFLGTVEGVDDPLKAGRVQVRCYSIHSESLTDMPTADLPWYYVATPTTSASISGVGESMGLVEGSTVFGIFLDGFDSQEGIVLGSWPAIPLKKSDGKAFSNQRKDFSAYPKHVTSVSYTSGAFAGINQVNLTPYPTYVDEPDTSKLSRGVTGNLTNTLKNASRDAGQVGVPTAFGGTWSQPANPYNAKYPFNKTKVTESGHVLEFDDTPGSERVNLFHRTGSYQEFFPDGSVVSKTVNNLYEIVHNNYHEHVENGKSITVDKGFKILVNKDNAGDGFDIQIMAGAPMNISVMGGNMNVNVTGNTNVTTSGTTTVTSGGTATINAPTATINAPNINLNGRVAIVGAGVTHNGVNIGATHVHGGVQNGGGSTSTPM